MKLKTSTNVVGAVIGVCNNSAQIVNYFAINYKCLYKQSVVLKKIMMSPHLIIIIYIKSPISNAYRHTVIYRAIYKDNNVCIMSCLLTLCHILVTLLQTGSDQSRY